MNHGANTSTYSSPNTYLPPTPPPDRVGGVPGALKGQADSIERLEGRLGELFAHLESGGVLRPSPPSATSGQVDGVPSPVVCSLAGEIQRGTNRLEVLSRQLDDVLKRLDI